MGDWVYRSVISCATCDAATPHVSSEDLSRHTCVLCGRVRGSSIAAHLAAGQRVVTMAPDPLPDPEALTDDVAWPEWPPYRPIGLEKYTAGLSGRYLTTDW